MHRGARWRSVQVGRDKPPQARVDEPDPMVRPREVVVVVLPHDHLVYEDAAVKVGPAPPEADG